MKSILIFVCAIACWGQGTIQYQTTRMPAAGAVTRSAQDKFAETVSILDFGGVGDGSTDNLAAYNAAYAAVLAAGGGRIFFPKGDYHFSAAVVIADPGIEIECESHYITANSPTLGVRIWGDSTTDDVIRVQPATKDITGGAIRNCHIEQNRSATGGDGIHVLAPGTATVLSISAAVAGSPTILTSTAHGLTTGQTITISGATSPWTGLNLAWSATVIDANTFSVSFNSTGDGSLAGTAIATTGVFQVRNFDLEWDTVGTVAGDGVKLEGYHYPGSGAVPGLVNVTWRINQDHLTVLTAGGNCFSYIGWVEQIDAIRPYCGGAGGDAFHLDSVGYPSGTAPLSYSVSLRAPATASIAGYPFYINDTQGAHITDPYNDDFTGPAYAYLNNTYGVRFDGVAHGGITGTQQGFLFYGANYGTVIDLPFFQCYPCADGLLTLESGATISALALYYKGGAASLGQVPFFATDWDTVHGVAPSSVGAVFYPGAMAQPYVPNVTTWAITNPSAADTLMRTVGYNGAHLSGYEASNPYVSSSPLFGLYAYPGTAYTTHTTNVFGETPAQENILASLLSSPLKIGTQGALPLWLYANSLPLVLLAPNGNVGIGNPPPATPAKSLHILGQLFIDNSPNCCTDTKSIFLNDATGNYAIGMAATGTAPFMQFDTGTTNSYADGFRFRINGAEMLHLSGDGYHILNTQAGLVKEVTQAGAIEFGIQSMDALGNKGAYWSTWDLNGRTWILGTGNPGSSDTAFTISEYTSGAFVSANAHFLKGGNIGFGRGNTLPLGTVHIFDAWPTTGKTELIVQAGAGNVSSDIAWQLYSYGGGSIAYIKYDGSTNLSFTLPATGTAGTYTKVTTDAEGRVTSGATANLSGSDVTGTLAAARFPALTGDVTNTAGALATTVGKIQGTAVSATPPTNGQVLAYSSGSSEYVAVTPSSAPSGSAGGDLSGSYPNPTVAQINGYAVGPAVSVNLLNQSSGVGSTNLRPGGNIATTGIWNIDYYFNTRSTGSAGTGILSFTSLDNYGSRTWSFDIDLTTDSITFGVVHGRVTLYTSGGSDITYAVTLSGATGSPTYDLHFNMQSY